MIDHTRKSTYILRSALMNTNHGITITTANAPNSVIGGNTAGAGNLISGHVGDIPNLGNSGIIVALQEGTLIQGNLVGTDVTGRLSLGNEYGIYLAGRASTIGGTSPSLRNIISGNRFDGVVLGSEGNQVQGNFIGTNISGTSSLGHTLSGVQIANASNNLIGGAVPGSRNIISGNNSAGIRVNGNSSTGNQVQGNYIGADVNGTADLGNTLVGVLLANGTANNTIGPSQVISGNNASGIEINSNATNNAIQGNYIGTDVKGTVPLGNGLSGVLISGAPNNTVGGTTSGARNVISGNAGGVGIAASTGNLVQGNFIGTDVNGTADIGNTFDGVSVGPTSSNNLIGGTNPGARNTISGNNGRGILISGSTSTGNRVEGNFIGTQADGTSALANSGDGITITASNNTIGGITNNAGNKIQNNGGDGVFVASGTGNAIIGNSIFANVDLGIDLGANGVTSNDSGDADSGANNLQNFPILTSTSSSGGNTTIKGTLNSKPSTAFALAFYSNNQCDPSGFGEGETPIGSSTGTTDSSGNANFIITLASSLPIGNSVTATATDPSGNTSEFSHCQSVSVPTFHLSVIVTGNGSVTSTQSGIVCPSDCDEDYPDATPVTLIALARSDSKFVGWSDCQGTGPCVISMTANRSVRANFVPKLKFTLAVTVTEGGAVISIPGGFECNGPKTCPKEYDEGEKLVLVAMPISVDWEFRGWQGLCLGNLGPCLVTMNGPIVTTAAFGRRTDRRITNPFGSPQVQIPKQLSLSYTFGAGLQSPLPNPLLRSGKDGAPAFGRESTDAGADTVKIELSRDNGKTFETLFANAANVGSACWMVTGPATNQALIRVSSTSNPSVFAISDQPFAIVNPSITGMQLVAGPTVCEGLSTSDLRSPIKGTLFFADRYSFSGSQGQHVAITLTSPAFDAYLYLVGPEGSVIAQDNDGGGATDARIPAASGFFTLPATGTYVIEATSFLANALGGYQLRLDSGALLLTAENTERALALDSVTMIRDPFPLLSTNFSSDHRTRVSLFVVNLELLPGEPGSLVTAQAEDSQHRLYPLTVEYVGRVPNFRWLTQVNVRLPDQLANAGDVWVRISLRGVVGNRALINIR